MGTLREAVKVFRIGVPLHAVTAELPIVSEEGDS